MFTSKKIKIERAFTIQNVSIKFGEDEKYSQFSMTFTIQNVSIKSCLPKTTYIVYHFPSFLSIPIFSYIFTQNFSLFFYITVKKTSKNQHYKKYVDVPVF